MMQQLPLERVERIRHQLSEDLLPGLVAVFSQAQGERLLLVYVGDPPASRADRQAIVLGDLTEWNLTDFDGPTLGLAAIDLIRPDLPTKGSKFVRLDRMLRRLGHVELLRQTWTDLAAFLTNWLTNADMSSAREDARHLALAEIAALEAPQKIAKLPVERRRGMIAYIPSRDQAVCLPGTPLESIAGLRLGPEEKVVALEEVRRLFELSYPEDIRDRFPIELRTILRRSHLDSANGEALLRDTLRLLASTVYERWTRTGQDGDCEQAYATALELHLAMSDVDDLVAVVPARFEDFLDRGAGTYVYRRPPGGLEPAPDVHRRHLDDAYEALARPAAQAVFTLLPLRGLASDASGPAVRWFELGIPLRKGGRTEILARNAWLLARDFLEASREQRVQHHVPLESLYQTIDHCCALFSLTDPWRTRQSRLEEWLRESYGLLCRTLDLLRQRSEDDPTAASYYAALQHWYGCADPATPVSESGGVISSLELMMETLRGRAGEPVISDSASSPLYEDAALLRRAGAALLSLLHQGGRPEAYQDMFGPVRESMPQVVSRASEMSRPLPLLSSPFRDGFQQFAEVVEAILRHRVAQIPVRDKIEHLSLAVDRLRQGQRLIVAPVHQARILHALYASAITETQGFLDQLKGGALLEVRLHTPTIAPDEEDSGIVLAVTNAGSVEAVDIEVELGLSDGYVLLDPTFKQALDRLAPQAEQAFRFALRSVTNDDVLRVRCGVSCSDPTGPRWQRTFEFAVRVVGLVPGPFQRKPNPYVFGPPLQEYRQFYGRRDELEQLLGHLANRRLQDVLLRGARRTGKTSLLYMVKAVLSDIGGRTGARTWFQLPHAWHNELDATVPVLLDLQSIDWGGIPTPTAFYQAVLGVLSGAGLRGATSEMLLAEPSVTSTQFVKALQEIVQDAAPRRPVILVDEFDVLDRIEDKANFFGVLRSMISSVQEVTWVIASALGLYQEARDYQSPLFNVFKIIRLQLLEHDAARRLVLQPWQPDPQRPDLVPLRFADDAVETIIEETGRYPYFIQLLCSEIVDYINAHRIRYVQHNTVLQVIDRRILTAGSEAAQHLDYLWDRARGTGKLILLTLLHHTSPLELDALRLTMLARLHQQGPVPGAVATLPGLDDNLEKLTAIDAIRHIPGAGYTYGIPLFRRLLLNRNERDNLDRRVYDEMVNENRTSHG